MKILHVVPSYFPATRYGGPIWSVHGLCSGLAAHGHEVHVFTTNVDGPGDSDVPLEVPVMMDGVKIWYFPSKHLRRLYWSPSMAKALTERVNDFDLVHLHSIYLWPTWAAARAARKNNVPYVISPRGMLVKDLIKRKSMLIKTAWITLIERRNLEWAAAIHVTSQLEKADVSWFNFRLRDIFIVPNGVNCNADSPGEKLLNPLIQPILKNGPYLLFLGRLNWKKGLDRLIPALSKIPNIPLVIVGNDEENYRVVLDRLIQEYDVADRVVFTGSALGFDKTTLLKNAAVLVVPSYSENFGNVVLEAMAEGCPVAVTPEVGASSIVQETGAGIIVNGDPECLAEALIQLLDQPQLREQMGRLGKIAVTNSYSWGAIADSMLIEYHKLLSSKNG